MKREVRRTHWYTAELNEKTNDTKVIKDQTFCINFFIISLISILSNLSTIQFRLAFKDKVIKDQTFCINFFIISLISILSNLSTIQFRLAFKDKGHKSLEYWCLVQTASSPSEKGGTIDNTSRNEIRPLFALVKLAPPLHKQYFR